MSDDHLHAFWSYQLGFWWWDLMAYMFSKREQFFLVHCVKWNMSRPPNNRISQANNKTGKVYCLNFHVSPSFHYHILKMVLDSSVFCCSSYIKNFLSQADLYSKDKWGQGHVHAHQLYCCWECEGVSSAAMRVFVSLSPSCCLVFMSSAVLASVGLWVTHGNLFIHRQKCM